MPKMFDVLTDAAVDYNLRWGHGSPIMMVHIATAPRAASLVLPALDQELCVDSYNAAWATSCALASIYRPTTPHVSPPSTVQVSSTIDEAVAGQDEHAIKFVEVAMDSHRRGMPTAAAAAARATAMLAPVKD